MRISFAFLFSGDDLRFGVGAVIALQAAPVVADPQEAVPRCEPEALRVHRQKPPEQRQFGEIALIPIVPEFIGAQPAHLGGVLELDIGLPRMPDAQQEAGEPLVSPALGVQPRDRIPEHLPPVLDAFDVLPERQRRLIDQGRNHPDLAPLGPGDKRVLFVGHNTQQNYKEHIPGPRPPPAPAGFPTGYNTPCKALGLRPDCCA